jgi:membrane-associated phospholipid phosphatase
MLPIAVAIGAARVFAHVHSWIDIIGGIAVGLIASGIAVTVTVYIIKQLSARHSKGEVHA